MAIINDFVFPRWLAPHAATVLSPTLALAGSNNTLFSAQTGECQRPQDNLALISPDMSNVTANALRARVYCGPVCQAKDWTSHQETHLKEEKNSK